MSPEEFDAACRELWRRCPFLSESSGRRTEKRNAAVGGSPKSKHIYGMARDFVAETEPELLKGASAAVTLGLWIKVHDVNSGNHLHVQGLPVGDISEEWLNEHWRK